MIEPSWLTQSGPALEGKGDLDYQFRIVLPDGQVRWIADQGEIQHNDAGEPTTSPASVPMLPSAG